MKFILHLSKVLLIGTMKLVAAFTMLFIVLSILLLPFSVITGAVFNMIDAVPKTDNIIMIYYALGVVGVLFIATPIVAVIGVYQWLKDEYQKWKNQHA